VDDIKRNQLYSFRITEFWVFFPSSGVLESIKHKTLRKLDLFPSSGEWEKYTYSAGSPRKSWLALSKGPSSVTSSGLRLALSKGKVYPPHSPEDGNRSNFPRLLVFSTF
jgi:hypothetical protein